MWDVLIRNGKLLPLDGRGMREQGYIGIENGIIAAIGDGAPLAGARQEIDVHGMLVMPALVDCHTHLMEYATGEVYNAQGPAQSLAGLANWMTALAHGIVTLGEHHLGHPVLCQPMETYRKLADKAPMEVYLAFGECTIGTDPLSRVAAVYPGTSLNGPLTEEDWEKMASASDFPGENLFLNATVANLPASLAPRAGEVVYEQIKLRKIVDIFHGCGKKVGAHIEGVESAQMFLEAGGDVIAHGHGLPVGYGKELARHNVAMVATPHAGTSSRPSSPQELYELYRDGVRLALATDSCIPPHPQADWYSFPEGYVVGPADLARVARPVFDYFLKQGVPLEEVVALITRNAYQMLDAGQPLAGTLQVGAPAHCIVTPGIPGVELDDLHEIKKVFWRGQLVVSR